MKRTDGLLTALLSASAFVATARLRKNPLQRARGRKASSKVRHQLFALAAIPLAASVYAVPGDFVGSEFRANTYRTDSQAEASVAWDHAGNAVVVWWSLDQDGSSGGIYGQRYGADGKSVGAEFRVNQTTNWSQYAPDVAMDAAGNFVVTWQSSYEDGTVDIFAQRYSAQGAAQGGEFRINSFTTGDQTVAHGRHERLRRLCDRLVERGARRQRLGHLRATLQCGRRRTARYSINGGAYVASGGTVSNGNTVRLRMTSAQPVGGAVAAMLTIGDRSDEWRVTTGSDSTPNDFSFPDVPSAAAEVVTTSASRTIVGFNGSLPISISGAGATYSIDGSAYTAVAGTITNGQRRAVAADIRPAHRGVAERDDLDR